jgi:flagellar biosynthesis/type III secretory pathway protein FliH
VKMSARERPKVKAECLRMLASLKLDPARTTLIGGFIDSYLQLTAQEMKQYERELAGLAPAEREATMELMTQWHREGRQEGRQEGLTQGKEALLERQLRRRLGAVSADMTARLARLSADELDDLGEALLDFTTPADLEQWFARH